MSTAFKNNIHSYFDTVMEHFALGLASFHKPWKHESQQNRQDVNMGKKTVTKIFRCSKDLRQSLFLYRLVKFAANVSWYSAQTYIKFENILNETI